MTQKQQTTELNVWREYCQHIFLMHLYRHPHADTLYFKGGTALRLLYNSPRFSEDLDFSSSNLTASRIEDCIAATMENVQREGISLELHEATQTTGGYLAVIEYRLLGQPVRIKLEISFRLGEKHGTFATVVNEYTLPYTLVQLEQSQLIGEKLNATLTRKKPRDFYDIYFILRSRLLPLELRHKLPAVLEALTTVSEIRFDRELREFLPHNHWAILRGLRKSIEQEIFRYGGERIQQP